MPLLGSSFAILKPAKMQIIVKIGVIQFWNAYEFVIISTTRTIFGYVVLHSVLKTFGVGVDIKLFYQSILDKDITSTQETYYDGAQALYDLRVLLICAVHGYCLGGLCYPAGADISIAVKGGEVINSSANRRRRMIKGA